MRWALLVEGTLLSLPNPVFLLGYLLVPKQRINEFEL